jgi:hypothetical protein
MRGTARTYEFKKSFTVNEAEDFLKSKASRGMVKTFFLHIYIPLIQSFVFI